VARLLPKVRDIRRIGSAALDLCGVASGARDAFYETGLQPWDRSAGLLIATEAGARVGVFPEPVEDRVLTVAAAPGLFDALHAAVTE
jgi:myo-inositol-1(or 4)-monophosphatase